MTTCGGTLHSFNFSSHPFLSASSQAPLAAYEDLPVAFEALAAYEDLPVAFNALLMASEALSAASETLSTVFQLPYLSWLVFIIP